MANLRDDQSLRSLNCMVELTRLPGSPVLGKDDIQVITMSSNDFIKVLPASTRTPQVTRTAANGPNRVLISYVGPETGFEVDHGFAERTTFVVTPDGKIAATVGGLNPVENVNKSLEIVQKLKKS